MEHDGFLISLKNVNDPIIHLQRLYCLEEASHHRKSINLNQKLLSDFGNIKLNYDHDLIIYIHDDLIKI